jgi:hypothetical protein
MPPCDSSGHSVAQWHFESPPGPRIRLGIPNVPGSGPTLAWPGPGPGSPRAAGTVPVISVTGLFVLSGSAMSDLRVPDSVRLARPWPPDPEPGSLARQRCQVGSSVSGPPRGQAASASGASLSNVPASCQCAGRGPYLSPATCTTAARTFDPTRRGGGGASALADGPSAPAAPKSCQWQPGSIGHSVRPSWPRRTPASMAKLTHSTPGWPWHRPVCGTQFALGESQSALTEKCPHAN